jgi:hypothetical protein
MDPSVGYQTLVGQLQAIQGQADVYKNASPLEARQHINNIATALSRDYGVNNLSDIGTKPTVAGRNGTTSIPIKYRGDPNFMKLVPTFSVGSDGIARWNENAQYKNSGWVNGQPVPNELLGYSFYNKNTGQEIPSNKFASEGAGEGYSNYNLQAIPDGKGGMLAVPIQEYSKSGFGAIAEDLAPLIAIAALAVQFIPGIGQAIGYAVLGAGDAIAGAALAGEIALATGVSSITAASIVSATGAATIAAGVTAAQGGDAADIVRAAATAGSASITNVAAGGGIVGAGAGSAVGTAIAGGNLDNVATNVVAAATGAAVTQQLGPGAGAIATDLVKTGGVSDRTLITAALAEGRVEGTPQSGASKIESLYDRLTAPAAKEGSQPITIGNATYQELQDGSAKVTRGSNVTIMSPDSFADVKEQYLQDMVTTPVTDPSTTLPPVNVTAGGEVGLSPTVTDTDVVNQIVAEQPSTTLDPVTIQGKREANVAPVVTGLDPVTVTAPTDVSTPVVTTPPAAPEEKEEEPKKEKEPEEKPKEQPTNLYPTITTLPPPKRPGRQPIITGESPSRLLADALSAYRPSGAIEGGESGKERQNVWNEKSLRLKDALGL